MATPLVSGCIALIREQLRRAKGTNYSPSAALIKALLIDGAQSLRGEAPHGAAPSFVTGFGRVDVVSTIEAIQQAMSYWDEGPALDSGEERSFSIVLPEAAAGMKITLVWTDFPGEVLQNDLDLIVAAAGGEWHGNMPAGSTEFDRKNNVEQVVLGALAAGNIDITVRAHRVAIGRQTFALVARAL
jgi:serine protease AprX